MGLDHDRPGPADACRTRRFELPPATASRSEVYRIIESGELPCTRVSEASVRFPKAELTEWLRERTTGARRATA